MNFRKSSKGGGGSFSIQKFKLQISAIIDDTSVMNFGKKLQYDFPKMRGGRSKAVWNFSENSSGLELCNIPYLLHLNKTKLRIWHIIKFIPLLQTLSFSKGRLHENIPSENLPLFDSSDNLFLCVIF